MKQRALSIKVFDVDGVVLFDKKPASPQDLMSVLQLFERDGLKITVDIYTIDIPSSGSSEQLKQ